MGRRECLSPTLLNPRWGLYVESRFKNSNGIRAIYISMISIRFMDLI